MCDISGHSPVKNVINVFPNVRSQAQELAVDTMKSRLQEVSFSGIFTVEQI